MSPAMPFTQMSYWHNDELPKLSQLTRANFGEPRIMKDVAFFPGIYNRQMVTILELNRVSH